MSLCYSISRIQCYYIFCCFFCGAGRNAIPQYWARIFLDQVQNPMENCLVNYTKYQNKTKRGRRAPPPKWERRGSTYNCTPVGYFYLLALRYSLKINVNCVWFVTRYLILAGQAWEIISFRLWRDVRLDSTPEILLRNHPSQHHGGGGWPAPRDLPTTPTQAK